MQFVLHHRLKKFFFSGFSTQSLQVFQLRRSQLDLPASDLQTARKNSALKVVKSCSTYLAEWETNSAHSFEDCPQTWWLYFLTMVKLLGPLLFSTVPWHNSSVKFMHISVKCLLLFIVFLIHVSLAIEKGIVMGSKPVGKFRSEQRAHQTGICRGWSWGCHERRLQVRFHEGSYFYFVFDRKFNTNGKWEVRQTALIWT